MAQALDLEVHNRLHKCSIGELAARRGTISQVTTRPAAAQHLRDLARGRDRIDRESVGNLIRIQEALSRPEEVLRNG